MGCNRSMRYLAALLGAIASIGLALATPAAADFGLEEFRISATGGTDPSLPQAGLHPFAVTTEFSFETRVDPVYGVVPDGAPKDLELRMPAGLVGSTGAVPRCSSTDFLAIDPETKLPDCSDGSAVGVISVKVALGANKPPEFISAPVYNLEPPPGLVQKLGFSAYGVPVAIEFGLDPDPPFSIAVSIANLSQPLPIYGSRLSIWGTPADPAHDRERGSCIVATQTGLEDEVHTSGAVCPAQVPSTPFLTLPRICSTPLQAGYAIDPWANPGAFVSDSVPIDDGGSPPRPLVLTGCGKLGFSPTVAVQPTDGAIESPTGLEVDLGFPSEGLTSAEGFSQSEPASAAIALPEGIAANPSAAAGLSACTPAEYRRETLSAEAGSGCPNASRVGTAEIDTPLLGELLEGSVFVAQPDDPVTAAPGSENPFDSLFALYVVVKNPRLGVILKQPVEVTADPAGGRLVARADDFPQVPFSHLRLHFRQGERALLTSPPSCGDYSTEVSLSPRSEPGRVVTRQSSFRTGHGLGGAPCPADGIARPFAPTLRAGALNPFAGTAGPFVLKMTRESGSQPIGRVQVRLPAGVSGMVAGVPRCPDSELARFQRDPDGLPARGPSCPGAEVGTVTVGAGAGGIPFYLGGRAYLAGPYEGAPLSLAVVVPAVGGPYDLGTVVVRVALHVDRRTAQVGAVSDPIPTILAGVPLNVRSIALNLDRPGFVRTPTSCKETSISGTATSLLGRSAPLSARFQVGGCAGLAFRPRGSLRLLGQTHRGAHPRLRAAIKVRPRQANIDDFSLTLPATELLESRSIGAVCGAAQLAADACPPTSVYGHAEVWTPLLDRPLKGPVYLRESGRRLPGLAVALGGQIDLLLTGHIDSVRERLRATFRALPDMPLSRLVLTMRGGEGGLLVNSGGLCRRERRVGLEFRGHNGGRRHLAPIVKTDCEN